MAVYSSLKNYPIVSQLDTKTLDHAPVANKFFNCVLASVMSTLYYFHPELQGKIDVDMMLDEVLGKNHVGGSDAVSFIAYAAKYGVKLSSINGLNPAQQIFTAHKMLQQGFPVIFTLTDEYVDTRLPQYAGWTHANTWHGEVPNGLVALDSLGDGTHITGGQNVTRTDAEWMARLRGSTLWIAENKIASSIATQPTHIHPATKVPTGWKFDNTTLVSPNGFHAQHGFAEYILTHNWNPSNLLVSEEYAVANGGTRQDCYSCALLYNPKDGVTLLEGDAFLQSLWEEVNHYSTLLSHDKALTASLQQQMLDAQSQAKNALASLSELQREYEQVKANCNSLQTQVTEEQGKTKNAQNQLTELQGQYEQTKMDYATLQSHAGIIQTQDAATITTLQQQVTDAQALIASLKQSLSAAGNVKAALMSMDGYIQQALKTFDEAVASPVVAEVPVVPVEQTQEVVTTGTEALLPSQA